ESPLSISDTSSSLTIVDDGHLRILDGERNTVWLTNITLRSNKTTAKLTDTGDFCLNDTISGMILWESLDYPSNSLLPGMKLGTNGETQGTHFMTSWKSDDDPTPGNFVVGLSEERPPQIFTTATMSFKSQNSNQSLNTEALTIGLNSVNLFTRDRRICR
nr:G-type lectin S-receptor-like serine/threonine-protein kinase At1g61550 [Tanacetum cinerariifolium]